MAILLSTTAGCPGGFEGIGTIDEGNWAEGRVQVATTTTGADIPTAGYQAVLKLPDGDSLIALPLPNQLGTAMFNNLKAGAYSLRLEGWPPNCSLQGQNPVSLQIGIVNAVFSHGFNIICDPNVGLVFVEVSTIGGGNDPDGYTLQVNGMTAQVGDSGTTSWNFGNVQAGPQLVQLSSVEPGCTVLTPNPVTVVVLFGASVSASFVVDCGGQTGAVRVTTETTGPSPDPDGYLVNVGGQTIAFSNNMTHVFAPVQVGSHTVLLFDVATNCAVPGATAQGTGTYQKLVTVTAGEATDIVFEVMCTPGPTGSLTVNTVTSGGSPDPDGYLVTLNGTSSMTIAANGTVSFPDLVPGDYQVGLTGIAPNCHLASGANPRTVPVAAGPATPTTFAIDCVTPIPSRLVFISSQDGDDEIFTMERDGTNRLQLTHNDSNEGDPDWSPDGARIVYESGEGASEIWVIQADGTNPVRLTNRGVESDDPDWSPDGTRIVFETDDGTREIAIMDADGGNLQLLTNTSAHSEKPQFSPDGTRILFASNRDGNYEIYVMNVDGTNVQQLTTDAHDDFDPAWSRDGASIVFVSSRDGDDEIYVMDADGGNLLQVTNNLVADWAPTWSPDGLFIVFTSDRDGDEDLFRIGPSGANELRLTTNFVSDKDADWQPPP
jgi:hypothetical protein